MDSPSVTIKIACCQHIAALRRTVHMKICKGLSNSKNMVLNVKRLLSDGMDLMPQRRGRKKLCEQNEGRF